MQQFYYLNSVSFNFFIRYKYNFRLEKISVPNYIEPSKSLLKVSGITKISRNLTISKKYTEVAYCDFRMVVFKKGITK